MVNRFNFELQMELDAYIKSINPGSVFLNKKQ